MKALAGLTLSILLGAMFVSLFHMSMDMMASGNDCIYMSHEETICPMSVADHLGAWQSVFQTVAPSFVLLLTALGALVVFVITFPRIFASKRTLLPTLPRLLRERTYTFTYRPLQELFSSGILHPKLF